MNQVERTSILISSMSKPEKRGFKLFCNTQKGEKKYLDLFDIINNLPIEKSEKVWELFEQENSGKNIEVVAGYLYKLLLDYLVQKRVEKSIQAKIFKQIEISKVLFERKLPDEAAQELVIASQMAQTFEDDIMQILTARVEMTQAGERGFTNLSEKELVNKQMKLQAIMKHSRTINQHSFLLDILNHRLLFKHFHTNKEERQMLTDLVLSELHIISSSSYIGFQAEKLHLLFQSAYYIEIGNYVSAVRNYKRLLELFEKNYHLIQNPPIYYLNALIGVLESLLNVGAYDEIKHFIDILHKLRKKDYPTDFLLKVTWLEYYYQIIVFLHTGDWDKMEDTKKLFLDILLEKISYLPLDIQLKFRLLEALTFFAKGKLKEAQKNLRPIFLTGKVFKVLPLFRLVRLVNLLILAESGGDDFIDVEIAALKRASLGNKPSKTERLILKFIQDYPLPRYQKTKNRLWTYYKPRINSIRQDKLERKILKYFDFLSFIESRITGCPFQDILKRKTNSEL